MTVCASLQSRSPTHILKSCNYFGSGWVGGWVVVRGGGCIEHCHAVTVEIIFEGCSLSKFESCCDICNFYHWLESVIGSLMCTAVVPPALMQVGGVVTYSMHHYSMMVKRQQTFDKQAQLLHCICSSTSSL